ncbi:hypothetical protein Vretimale_538 [Volvox reticuliferus]|uniref:Uncharacterized protein n=1 Tax=Volvox reticuliferus TaxID=1737510 RepID=A0A8J4FIC9_9CHLO|nr:hypothetical protein Vretifemale_2501 [Volvox reticuliferus]GIL94297.1 hypothetical protein Vretimale_538 [Volvox reticuliferus]
MLLQMARDGTATGTCFQTKAELLKTLGCRTHNRNSWPTVHHHRQIQCLRAFFRPVTINSVQHRVPKQGSTTARLSPVRRCRPFTTRSRTASAEATVASTGSAVSRRQSSWQPLLAAPSDAVSDLKWSRSGF